MNFCFRSLLWSTRIHHVKHCLYTSVADCVFVEVEGRPEVKNVSFKTLLGNSL